MKDFNFESFIQWVCVIFIPVFIFGVAFVLYTGEEAFKKAEELKKVETINNYVEKR